MNKALLMVLTAIVWLVPSLAPAQRTCAGDPTSTFQVSTNYQPTIQSTGTIVIPVVFHVLYNTSTHNISDDRIIAVMNVLNEDFRRMVGTNGFNGNISVAADAMIEFKLADRSPSNAATNGITRHHSSQTTFTANGSLSNNQPLSTDETTLVNHAFWDPTKYLNVWIVPDLAGGVIGAALKFPDMTRNIDGIVMPHDVIGDAHAGLLSNYDLGRTLTHEVGHYLGLYHTFTGGCMNSNCASQGDHVCDTPPTNVPASTCSNVPSGCGVPAMIENYMDYAYDACMNVFTQGQSDRMDYAISTYRSGLGTSTGLVGIEARKDFLIFSNHDEDYDYNVSERAILLGGSPYADMELVSGATATVRAGKEIVMKPGTLIASGSTFHAHIDDDIYPKLRHPRSQSAPGAQSDGTAIAGIAQPMLTVVPNPANSTVSIDIRNMPDGIGSMELIDATGRRVLHERVETSSGSGQLVVDVSGLGSGVYLCRVSAGEVVEGRSLVIAR